MVNTPRHVSVATDRLRPTSCVRRIWVGLALVWLLSGVACNAIFDIAPPELVEDGPGGHGGEGGRNEPEPSTTHGGEPAAEAECERDGSCANQPILPGNACDERGLIACVETKDGVTVARVRCDGKLWQHHDPCADAELCDPDHDESGGCTTIPAACLGRAPDESFCEGAVRKTCGPTLLRVSSVTCPSVEHCALGDENQCAVCLPDTYECEGQVLKSCNDAGTAYVETKTCTDPTKPCRDKLGQCSADPCTRGQKFCEGDILQVCAEDLSGFIEFKPCKAGLCDQTNKECDVCVAGTSRCEDGKKVTCSDDGQHETTSDCEDEKPYCVGAGNCVECTQKDQCSAGECSDAVCEHGTCGSVPAHSGDECSAGHCSADGHCVACLSPSHCPVDGDCFTPTCNGNTCGQTPRGSGLDCDSSGGRFCNGSGACVDCINPAQCSITNDCYTPTCNNNTCGQTPRGPGLDCDSDGGNVCNGSGACVDCTNPAQCSITNDCYTPTCNNNTCGQTPRGSGLDCDSDGGNVCNGSGACVECTDPDQCSVTTECYIPVCSGNICGQSPQARGIGCGSGNVCNGEGSCVPNVPYTVGESSATGWTTFAVPDDQWWVVPVLVPRTASLQGLRLIGGSASGQARMAVWADDNGAPGAFVAQTTNFGMAQGVVSQPPTSGTQLSGGQTYWVGAKFTGDASIFYDVGFSDFYTLDQPFAAVPSVTLNPFPVGAAVYDMGISLNFFLLLLDVPQ